MIGGQDIVCLSFVAWDDVWGTPQHLISRLGKQNRVLFVDPPISPFSFITGAWSGPSLQNRVRQYGKGSQLVAQDIHVAMPPPVLPLRYRTANNRISANIIRPWLQRQVRELGFRSPIVWNFQPAMPGIGRALDPIALIYHCVDDFSSVPHWWNSKQDVQKRDNECTIEADAVICTGQTLADYRRLLNPEVHFVPNAADVDLFALANHAETPVPPEIGSLPGPVVGLCGVIDFRVDIELLARMARRRPDWSFALVGPIKGGIDLSPLTAVPNVHFFGPRMREALPGYLKAMDVCLIPYVLSAYTQHVFPLKFFEFLSAGKPIVSTDLPELRSWNGDLLVIAASNDEDCCRAVERAMSTNSAALQARRQQAARANSWDRRAEQVSRIVEPLLELRGLAPGLDLANPARFERAGVRNRGVDWRQA